MSKINDLIAEYCPDGVEFKRLGDVALYPKKRIAANEVVQNAYVGVESLLSNMQGRRPVTPVPNESSCIEFLPKDILLGNIRPYLKKIWLSDIAGGTNGDVIVLRLKEGLASCLMPDFLFEVLKGDSFFSFFIQHSRGGKMPRGDKKQVLTFRIPIPPLPVQEEIVRILDSFSSLEAELEAELEARRKQYAYYRNELLTFDRERVQWLKLGEAAFINKGTYITKKQVIPGNIPVILGGVEPAYWHSESNHDGEGIVISRSGANAGFASYWNEPIFVSDGFVLDAKPGIDMRFLFHVLKKQQAKLHSMKRGSGVPHINSKMLANNVAIPVPPLEEQQHVVSILDRFDKLTNDLSSGLPAEIEARRKQYEYYRDRLLSFDELAV